MSFPPLSAAAGMRPGVVSGACSGAAGCTCQVSLALPQSEVGTYTTSGNVIACIAIGSTTSTADYCIQGTTGHFMTVSMGTGAKSSLIRIS